MSLFGLTPAKHGSRAPQAAGQITSRLILIDSFERCGT
ncbi:hypothetical protein N177_3959 [Lutibaculum baratangense AMV1]|uniref:Uncharacterized protein n=1 Tax=Lutibaculum baratangense AMV1 TaxID=631454 RepID=V4QSS1_9HYPH|nr:hypothetical protein N177_3959 [Lutibaculum baratangense AMV1]